MLQETERHHKSGRASPGPHTYTENRRLEPISAERRFQKQVPIEKDECFLQYHIYFPAMVVFFSLIQPTAFFRKTCQMTLFSVDEPYQKVLQKLSLISATQEHTHLPYTSKALYEANSSHCPVFPYPPHSFCPLKAHSANLDYGIFILYLFGDF